ncbi:SulP family inorganic anion transporter [Thermomonospora catenispora]|uniref:SulP family inorganic anion transporter n=1 Tax=Thermomonospora catenispora TaxID=2493090 RepID=UPI00111FE996|nr:SulP family inorganic anion transporter [Thermomonospora catenispora]TNY37117.1 SulP family inorganic anion transporter [Thermomonospora catenispora]
MTAETWRRDLAASFAVFLVALPLCVGIAVASGVPAELGLVTGIVGGLVVGPLPGSSLQVSGPAAGLTVLVHDAVHRHGPSVLGMLVLAAGLLQILLGALRMGRWFRAITVAVVEGMLAGIGLTIIAGQLYAMADVAAPDSGPARIAGLPALAVQGFGSAEATTAVAVGAGTIAVLAAWPRLPARIRAIPAPLAAVALATAVVAAFDLPAAGLEVNGLAAAIRPPGVEDLARLAEIGVLGTVLALALISSAESLFSAAAVDRMHDGPRTHYDKELMAQGAGNAVCGALGALPMTAVIVRSSANLNAGARTKASRVLHGAWLLLFAALFPAALEAVPLAALSGVLIHTGWKLIPFGRMAPLWREHRGEAVVLLCTMIAVVALNLLEGVLLGLLLAVLKTAWETSHVSVRVDDDGAGPIRVTLTGNATFLRLPNMLDALEALPRDRRIELDLSGLRHLDHACRTALIAWADRHRAHGGETPAAVAIVGAAT